MDVSKAFHRVWHDGLIYKVKCIGIIDMFLKLLITTFLKNRFQRVVLNGQTSSWEAWLAGVHQGFVLGPLFFLFYINDRSENLFSNIKLFADDTLSTGQLNSDLENISNWDHQLKMSFNPDPKKQTQEVIFSRKRMKDSFFQ